MGKRKHGISPSTLLIALLALILPIFAATPSIEPKYVGSADATVNLVWRVDLQGQQVSELEVKTFGFGDYSSQLLISELSSPSSSLETDPFGNKIRVFNLPGTNYLTFSQTSELQLRFKFEFPPASGTAEFLKPSRYVLITPEIRERAVQITAGIQNDLGKAVAIAQWVHNNVQYDRDYTSRVEASDVVYKERAGTCDEFSHLFIAMLRSVGIPAKFSASYVYSGEDWGAHAVVEAAIDGKWVPFDPTFNEAILLDATHIKFGEGLDQGDIKEDISVRGYSADVSQIKLSREFDVEFSKVRNFDKLFDLQLILPSNVVGEKSLETVKVKVINGPRQLAIPLSLTVPKEVKVQGQNRVNEDKLLLLGPNEEKTAEWSIVLPKLESGYDYKFPVRVDSLGQNAEGTIAASDNGDFSEKEDLQVTEVGTNSSPDGVSIIVRVKNTGNVFSYGTISVSAPGVPSQKKELTILVGDEQKFVFSLGNPEGEVMGEIAIETQTLRVSQPFRLSTEPSEIPSEEPTIEPTAEPPRSFIPGMPDDYLFIFALVLIVLVFLTTTRLHKL
ncbi:MAG: transglutaminase-like domain-containing protein [Candidatus Micrarchaeota archaeon]